MGHRHSLSPAVPLTLPPCRPYLVMLKELQQEGGHSGRDTNEEIDDDKKHVGRAGDLKPEGSRVHDGGDGPPAGGQAGGSQQAPEPAPHPLPLPEPPYP